MWQLQWLFSLLFNLVTNSEVSVGENPFLLYWTLLNNSKFREVLSFNYRVTVKGTISKNQMKMIRVSSSKRNRVAPSFLWFLGDCVYAIIQHMKYSSIWSSAQVHCAAVTSVSFCDTDDETIFYNCSVSDVFPQLRVRKTERKLQLPSQVVILIGMAILFLWNLKGCCHTLPHI